jgi:hypothetical protein
MALGRLLVAAATSVACFFAGREAIAIGRLLTPSGSENGVSQVRMAIALAPRQSTAWCSLDLQGPKRPVVLVVPASRGTAIDPASSRWFQALERVTAPRVVLSALCGAGDGSRVHDTSDGPRAAAIDISELAVLSSLDEVAAFAAARGVAFEPADRASLLPHSVANQFVAFAYDVPEIGGMTETLRMTWRGTEAGALLQLALSRTKVPVALWTIAGGRAGLPPAREHESRELTPVWKVAGGRSDYPERRQAWVGSRSETAWLLEATGDDFLFDWRVLPQSLGTIQPLISSYFAEASGGACTARVLEARSAGGRVAPACAKGELWVETSGGRTPCVESAAAGEIEPEALRCGTLDDFALALSDQEVDQTWVTRHRGVLFPMLPQSVQISGTGSGRVSPIVSTSSVDVGRCGSTGGTSGAGGGFGAGGASSGGTGGFSGASGNGSQTGGWGGRGSRNPDPSDPPPGVYDETNVEVGCASSGGDADCGGDSSSDGGDESCSGDSSSEDSEGCGSDSSDDGGDDCGGDSSDDGGDDCGGDSSSEGGDDCSGDSSSEGGDDCSGDSGGGGDDCSGDSGGDCSGETAEKKPAIGDRAVQTSAAVAALPRPRRFRPRVSAVTLVLCALALFLRRSSRRECDAVVPR